MNGSLRVPSCVLLLVLSALLASCAGPDSRSPAAAPAAPAGNRLFAFGIVTDVQFADKPAKGKRHHRKSLGRLVECVQEFNRRDVVFAIQLGDMIDGNDSPEKTLLDLDSVLQAYRRLKMPAFHVVGDQCLLAERETLQEKLGMKLFYYDFAVPEMEGWRFIVLDGNAAGPGGLGEVQLAWFRRRLMAASRDRERVVVFCHYPLLKAAAPHQRMADPDPVLRLMADAGCVVAYFAGHDHAGGCARQDGIHHVTLRSVVEAPPGNAFAVIEVYRDGLKEIGFGQEPSRSLR